MPSIGKLLPVALLVACARGVTSPSYQVTHAAPLPPAGQTLAADATIRFVDIEGGCWALATAAGHYEPVGLPAALRRDGQNVRAWFHARADLGSFCMLGPIVQIDSAVAR